MQGAIESLVGRSVQLMRRVKGEAEFTLIGGILRFESMARAVRQQLHCEVNVPESELTQFVSAIGAAALTNLAPVFAVLSLLSAGAANARGPAFYAGLFALTAWALWAHKPSSASRLAWAALLAAAGAAGWAGQIGLARLQERLESSDLGRSLISAFLIVTLGAVLATNIQGNSKLRREVTRITQPYSNATGIDGNQADNSADASGAAEHGQPHCLPQVKRLGPLDDRDGCALDRPDGKRAGQHAAARIAGDDERRQTEERAKPEPGIHP
jgi:hypothetical protein